MSTTGLIAIGDPLPRVDGGAKVRGAARYSAEFPLPGLAYASLVMSTIPSGHMSRMETGKAERRRV